MLEQECPTAVPESPVYAHSISPNHAGGQDSPQKRGRRQFILHFTEEWPGPSKGTGKEQVHQLIRGEPGVYHFCLLRLYAVSLLRPELRAELLKCAGRSIRSWSPILMLISLSMPDECWGSQVIDTLLYESLKLPSKHLPHFPPYSFQPPYLPITHPPTIYPLTPKATSSPASTL